MYKHFLYIVHLQWCFHIISCHHLCMRWLQTWSLLVSCITSFLFTICVWGDYRHEICLLVSCIAFASFLVTSLCMRWLKTWCLFVGINIIHILPPTHLQFQFCVLFQSYMSPVDLIHSALCIIVWHQWFGFKHKAAHTHTANINCVQSWVYSNRIQLRFSLYIQHTSNRMIIILYIYEDHE